VGSPVDIAFVISFVMTHGQQIKIMLAHTVYPVKSFLGINRIRKLISINCRGSV